MPEIKRYTPEPDFVSGEFERVEMQERRDGEWVRYEDVLPLFAERVCPCVIASEPCRPVCSCVEWVSSYGCKCCTHYGSLEQRKARAEQIVQSMVEFDTEGDPVGWAIVAVGDDGTVLCRSPNGRRARFAFGGER